MTERNAELLQRRELVCCLDAFGDEPLQQARFICIDAGNACISDTSPIDFQRGPAFKSPATLNLAAEPFCMRTHNIFMTN